MKENWTSNSLKPTEGDILIICSNYFEENLVEVFNYPLEDLRHKHSTDVGYWKIKNEIEKL